MGNNIYYTQLTYLLSLNIISNIINFEYELQLAFSNQYLDKEVDMVFLMTRPSHSFISSSAVKEMVSHNRRVTGLVPPCVEEALQKKLL